MQMQENVTRAGVNYKQAYDDRGRKLSVGDHVLVRPERLDGAKLWRGEIVKLDVLQDIDSEKLVLVQPHGAYLSKQPVEVLARLCELTSAR